MTTTEYRVRGVVGPDDVEVMTEWLDEDRMVVEGIKAGLDLRGWRETYITERERE